MKIVVELEISEERSKKIAKRLKEMLDNNLFPHEYEIVFNPEIKKYKSCLLCIEENQEPFEHNMKLYSNFAQIDNVRLHLSCFIRQISHYLLENMISIMLDPKSEHYSNYIKNLKRLYLKNIYFKEEFKRKKKESDKDGS